MAQEIDQIAYLPNYSSKISSLVELARPERWDNKSDQQSRKHQVLVNYINHTFKRLQTLKKLRPKDGFIVSSENYICFDTGLFTNNFEPIYGLFVPNDPGHMKKWQLDNFYKKSDRKLRAIPQLPRRAEYFDDFKDLIYDTRLDLRVNIDHILNDEKNRARIPEKYRELPNLPMLFSGAALEYAKIRIKENYKSAVPQYFRDSIQFLIPISLGDPAVVDLSLAVGREGDIYTGHTCLTLDMAYNNARLIAKPESDWLV